MRFMIMVRATADTERGVMPEQSLIAEMAAFHEELAKAGVLVDAAGLQPSAKGWRIRYHGNDRTVVDGPFVETKELIAGYTLIEVKSREEALEWTKRFPHPATQGDQAEIEVRQLYGLEDFPPGEGIDRFRELEQSQGRANT